ncbi:phage shock protein A [Pseudoalteromonas ulvae UL12]|uniref:phage shock protein PspA n=1 Tax=Pseudoalteromonas ulvae TaxID=107327 RepID=UPI00186BAA09|nr:phage shock protein PspA [Pseudoalteromonas ulvae]MBE0363086.1 phage shock protein A [Pseudoalteromonas ulvae UL12]
MGVFTRITDIVQANVVAALDKAENPEKLVNLMIQEMEETLVEVRSTSAKLLAEKKELQRKEQSHQQQVNYWQEKAELAIDKNRDDLAKAALVEKQQVAMKFVGLSKELSCLDESLAKLTADSARLNEKLTQAKAKRDSFQQREQMLSSRLKVKSQLQSDKVADALSRFDLIERKVDEIEAKVESYELGSSASLAQQFNELSINEDIENELAELKSKKAAK